MVMNLRQGKMKMKLVEIFKPKKLNHNTYKLHVTATILHYVEQLP